MKKLVTILAAVMIFLAISGVVQAIAIDTVLVGNKAGRTFNSR